MTFKEDRAKMDKYKFIAGAIAKFGSLDNIDYSLLVEDFTQKLNISPNGRMDYFLWTEIGNYITQEDNGTIRIVKGLSLDTILKDQNCTLKERLLEIAGDTVVNYFDSLDIESYRLSKEKALLEYMERLLATARILLISDKQEDYDELVKYGFKNVDYFKSIIRANNYFTSHLDELKKYHIILLGSQCLSNRGFEEKLLELRKQSPILFTKISRYNFSNRIDIHARLYDAINYRTWKVLENNYSGIFDKIVEAAFISKVLERVKVNNCPFVPIADFINPVRLPSPKLKADLKILYLNRNGNEQYLNKIANILGLTIQFVQEDIHKYVINNLGKWDIIIGSRIYSRDMLEMSTESTEQCKDTGRDLTLLAVQDNLPWEFDYQYRINAVKLGYVYGGRIAPDDEYHEKKYAFLIQSQGFEGDEDLTKNDLAELSKARSVIESVVCLYNEALLQAKLPAISDLNFRSAEDFYQDYLDACAKAKAAQEAAEAAIKAFDEIRLEATSYLENLHGGLINRAPEGLNIMSTENGIRIENIYNAESIKRVLCAIVLPNENNQRNIRIFDIQIESKKGRLTPPQTIGLYTHQFDNSKGIPDKPTEAQAQALGLILKKINIYLKPLNDEAYRRKASFRNNRNRKKVKNS